MSNRSMNASLVLLCALAFLHHAGAQMRGLVLPLHAAALGASAGGVGLVAGAHTIVAAIGSIPLGRASDLRGRRPFLLGGMGLGILTSVALALVDGMPGLALLSGLAGLGIAAFSPSALSLVADSARPGALGRAYAWYSTAHYGAIAAGPFLGGLAAERWGHRGAFLASAAVIALAALVGLRVPAGPAPAARGSAATFAQIRGNAGVWAGWVAAVSGLLVQGVVFTFFPLVASGRGLGPAAIGLVFLVLGAANTAARLPAGWLVDRTGRAPAYAIGGLLAAAIGAALLPRTAGRGSVLALAGGIGAVSGLAFVAISVALAGSAPPAARGVVMGGYSAALYLGLALGSFGFGPVIASRGYGPGFAAGAAAGLLGAIAAGALWLASARGKGRPRTGTELTAPARGSG